MNTENFKRLVDGIVYVLCTLLFAITACFVTKNNAAIEFADKGLEQCNNVKSGYLHEPDIIWVKDCEEYTRIQGR